MSGHFLLSWITCFLWDLPQFVSSTLFPFFKRLQHFIFWTPCREAQARWEPKGFYTFTSFLGDLTYRNTWQWPNGCYQCLNPQKSTSRAGEAICAGFSGISVLERPHRFKPERAQADKEETHVDGEGERIFKAPGNNHSKIFPPCSFCPFQV